MARQALICERCKFELPRSLFGHAEFAPCPQCETPTRVVVFPALLRVQPAGAAAAILVGSEASCFNHPARKTMVPYDGCGRFLCALCDVELEDKHYCPSCLESGKSGERVKSLQNRVILYDSIALSLAVVPLLVLMPFFFFTLVTAPMAIYLSVRASRQPRGILSRSRWRAMLALGLGLIQVGGWLVLAVIGINRLLK